MATRDRGDGARGNEAGGAAKGKRPRLIGATSWVVLLASFALSFSTWIALGELAGFKGEANLAVPYIGSPRLAWLFPVAYDGYVCVALMTWMARVPESVAIFAKRNTYVAAGFGALVQSAYHGFLASATGKPALMTLAAFVGAVPVAVSALAIHMRTLVAREGEAPSSGTPRLVRWVASTREALASRPEKPAEAPEAPAVPSVAPVAPVPVTVPSGREEGKDELAPRRVARAEGDEAMALALHKAWGNEPPARQRDAAKRLLRVGSTKADAALKEYARLYLGSDTERASQ